MGDEPDAGRVPLEHSQARRLEQRHELRGGDARPRDVGKDDVRLDRLRPQADARDRREPRAEGACTPVVVRDAVEHRVQRDEARRRGDAGAVDARAAEALQHRPGPTDDRLAPGEHGAERRREALVEGHHDGVRGRGEVGERDTERSGRVHETRAVDVDTTVVPLGRGGEGLGQLRRQRRPAGPRVRVLEDEQGGSALADQRPPRRPGSIRPSASPDRRRLEPRDLDDPHRLGREDVGGRLEHDAVSRLAERQQCDQVGHPARGHPHRRGLAEQLRHAPAELVHRGVLADGRPPELGPPHRLPHLARRNRAEIGAQVDHERSRCRPVRAPVCSPPSTAIVPLTSTCSTPRA